MTFREYQEQARRTQNPALSPRQRTEHATWLLSSEVGEVCGIFQKTHQGHELNLPALRKEIGDVLWGLSELCDVFDWDMGAIAEKISQSCANATPKDFPLNIACTAQRRMCDVRQEAE
jgi:NTP pyrophosphatase (non-canonical NTP hydrolase)